MRGGGRVAILMFAAILLAGWTAPENAAGQGLADVDVVPFGQVRPGSYDDGWRRTANGWEHVADWPEFASLAAEFERSGSWRVVTASDAEQVALVPGRRLDFHPALLALLMVALLLGLTCFAATSPRAEVS